MHLLHLLLPLHLLHLLLPLHLLHLLLPRRLLPLPHRLLRAFPLSRLSLGSRAHRSLLRLPGLRRRLLYLGLVLRAHLRRDPRARVPPAALQHLGEGNERHRRRRIRGAKRQIQREVTRVVPLEELGALKRALVRAAGVEVKPRRVRDRARGRRHALLVLRLVLRLIPRRVKRRVDGVVQSAPQVGVFAVRLERSDELAVHPAAARREPEEPAGGLLRGGVHLPVQGAHVGVGRGRLRFAEHDGSLARRQTGHGAASQKASRGGAVRPAARRGRVRPFRDFFTHLTVRGGNSLGQDSLASSSSLGPLPRRVSGDSRVPAPAVGSLHGELVHRIPSLDRLEGNRLRVDAVGRVRELAVHP